MSATNLHPAPRMVPWPAPRPPMVLPDLVATDPAYRAVYERALAYYRKVQADLDATRRLRGSAAA